MRFVGLFFLAVAAVQAQQASSPTRQDGSPFLSIPPEHEGLRFEVQVPPFEAKDIAGRTWRLEDLRGKLTLIYVWNTSRLVRLILARTSATSFLVCRIFRRYSGFMTRSGNQETFRC